MKTLSKITYLYFNILIFDQPLDKVIKKNPRYEHVQKTIDTGSSMTKYLKKIEEIKTSKLKAFRFFKFKLS